MFSVLDIQLSLNISGSSWNFVGRRNPSCREQIVEHCRQKFHLMLELKSKNLEIWFKYFSLRFTHFLTSFYWLFHNRQPLIELSRSTFIQIILIKLQQSFFVEVFLIDNSRCMIIAINRTTTSSFVSKLLACVLTLFLMRSKNVALWKVAATSRFRKSFEKLKASFIIVVFTITSYDLKIYWWLTDI